MRKAEISLRVQ